MDSIFYYIYDIVRIADVLTITSRLTVLSYIMNSTTSMFSSDNAKVLKGNVGVLELTEVFY